MRAIKVLYSNIQFDKNKKLKDLASYAYISSVTFLFVWLDICCSLICMMTCEGNVNLIGHSEFSCASVSKRV